LKREKISGTVTIELDGQDIELIIHELSNGIIRESTEKNQFRAKQLNKIMQRLIIKKQEFHHTWGDMLFWK